MITVNKQGVHTSFVKYLVFLGAYGHPRNGCLLILLVWSTIHCLKKKKKKLLLSLGKRTLCKILVTYERGVIIDFICEKLGYLLTILNYLSQIHC